MPIVKNAALSFLCTVIFLIFLEGASSLIIFGRNAMRRSPSITIQFDPEIGWTGLPNLYLKDHFGPETYLKTNSLGLVADREYREEIPSGKTRVLCSGNSFPAGEGVGNGKNWCHRLEEKGPIEAINLSQLGYSLDQTFLTYKRFRPKFRYNVHVYSFTGIDFEFLLRDNYTGKQKPLLAWKDGQLTQLNAPLKKVASSYRTASLFTASVQELRIAHILMRFLKPSLPEQKSESSSDVDSIPLATSILKEVQKLTREDKSKLLFVYQPTYQDLYLGKHKELRKKLAEVCASNHLPFYDLTPDLSDFSVHDMVEGGNGHYIAPVHDKIAELITKRVVHASDPH